MAWLYFVTTWPLHLFFNLRQVFMPPAVLQNANCRTCLAFSLTSTRDLCVRWLYCRVQPDKLGNCGYNPHPNVWFTSIWICWRLFRPQWKRASRKRIYRFIRTCGLPVPRPCNWLLWSRSSTFRLATTGGPWRPFALPRSDFIWCLSRVVKLHFHRQDLSSCGGRRSTKTHGVLFSKTVSWLVHFHIDDIITL